LEVRCEQFHFALGCCISIQNHFVNANDHTRERWQPFKVNPGRSDSIEKSDWNYHENIYICTLLRT
jgi:hypothetical protein